MKIAVLISGEYRTFGICRDTMKFLDDPRVDIYITTWDKTIYDEAKIGYHVKEDITVEQIEADMRKPAVIDIEPCDTVKELRYNSKMVHKWKRGLQLIKDSNVEYDYVLMIRPDLFFTRAVNHSFNFVEKYKDKLGFGWFHPETQPGFLNDIIVFSSYNLIMSLFDPLTVETWANANNSDWHTWWYSYAIQYVPEIVEFSEMDSCNFCRPWVEQGASFSDVCQAQDDWSDLKILNIMDVVGREHMIERWAVDIVDRAEQKWKSGVYEKYKLPEKKSIKVALIISGMLRNYDTALLSLDIWGECDRYLVTWESAGKEAIDDYSAKANIKKAFVIPDSEFERVYLEPCKNGNHTFNMVYLWNQAYKNVPKGYDKYVVIRPDGFYWTNNRHEVLECIESEGPFKTSQTRVLGYGGINDHVLIMDKSHFNKLQNCYIELRKTALAMIADGTAKNKYGDWLNPHEMLFRMWNQRIRYLDWGTDVDMCSSRLDQCVDMVIVRNTFKPLPVDRYNQDLYKAVFYDTAAWWRNNIGINYHGILHRLK